MHDCNQEYWQHCIDCVVGDSDAEVTYWGEPHGPETYAEVHYPDGDQVRLVRGPDGWVHKE